MNTYVAEHVLMAASEKHSHSKCKFQLPNEHK